MVKDGWLHEGRRTDSRRKRMTDRTKNDNLSLSNCVEEALQIAAWWLDLLNFYTVL
jgi:hypothetical protein